MTDEDRQLLLDLTRLTKACGAFCAGVLENDLSRDDQVALGEWLVEMGGRIRERGVHTPVVIEGEAVRSAGQTGQARMTQGGAAPKVAPVGWVFVIDRHRHDGFTIRWRRGDPVAYVLSGRRLGDHSMGNVLDTIPSGVTGRMD